MVREPEPSAAAAPPFGVEPVATLRLFAGVWPSEEVVAALAALPRPAVRGVRWTTVAQWHVTVAFLGAVAEPALGALGAALRDAVACADPVEARVGPATERLGRSLLCAPVTGLDALAATTRAALAAALPTPVPDPVPFRGHLTLARAHRRHAIPASLVGTPVAGSWTPGAVCLVRSELDPDGARYTTLVEAPVPH